MDYGKILEYAGRVSVGVLVILILVAGSQGYWVYGSTYRDAIADRDTWKQLALKGANLSVRASSGTKTGTPPLTHTASPRDVRNVLDDVQRKFTYKTEPTDAPLP